MAERPPTDEEWIRSINEVRTRSVTDAYGQKNTFPVDGPDPERDRRLRTLAIDRRQPWRAPTPEELRNAREAQKWADHIHERETRRIQTERRDRDLATDNQTLGEIPAWTPDQLARLRYIAATGRLPPADLPDLADAAE